MSGFLLDYHYLSLSPMRVRISIITAFAAALITGCAQIDTSEPLILLIPDSNTHYRTEPYSDPGFDVADDQTCLQTADVIINNPVNTNLYGTYLITYSAADASGNIAVASRNVDIVLPLKDYYNQTWNAYDTCTSGNIFYTGLIQDCDCPDQSVIVGNISNFGLSASFTLPVSGQYNHMITLDTTKAAVTFFGTGVMNPSADTLFWEYIIMDSVSTDVCRSTWIK